MSAWIVDKANIDVLVEAFFRYEIAAYPSLTPDALGRLLWKENHKSVNYRYSERTHTPKYVHEAERVVYQHHPTAACGTVREIAHDGLFLTMQIACYDYQSCEHPRWRASTAYRITALLLAAVLKSLGMTEKEAYNASRKEDGGRRIGEVERYPWSITYTH